MKKLMLIRRGSCKRCGVCEDKAVSQPDKWDEMTPTDDPDVRLANGKPFNRVCKDFSMDKEGLACCAVYEDRPEVCRTFPKHPNDLKLLPGCGYYFTLEWRDEDG